ncbi:MAG: DUF4328 domain-containing protein [Bacteroidota bacterium]|jgi:hypothetical protein
MNFLYNNKSLIRVLQVTVWLYIIIYICSAVQIFMRQGDPIKFHPDAIGLLGENSQYYIQLLITLVNAFVSLAFCILFIVWFYRAYENVSKADPAKATIATGWAIGCWFVPIMNLFRPLRIMLEIWHGTQTAGEEPDRPLTAERSIQVNAWWYCWTFGLAIGLLGTYLQIRGISSFNFEEFPDYEEWRQNSIQAFKKVQFILLVSSILQLISLYMLNQLLNRLSKFEAELRERLFIAFSRQPTSYEPPVDLPR